MNEQTFRDAINYHEREVWHNNNEIHRLRRQLKEIEGKNGTILRSTSN